MNFFPSHFYFKNCLKNFEGVRKEFAFYATNSTLFRRNGKNSFELILTTDYANHEEFKKKANPFRAHDDRLRCSSNSRYRDISGAYIVAFIYIFYNIWFISWTARVNIPVKGLRDRGIAPRCVRRCFVTSFQDPVLSRAVTAIPR